ncbi:MAG TPA: DNA polymerase III subunit delta' [Burkholderiales bacterium]|jgi:DNA polymerase-3 subunit delta'|nr:DNA polymerase III subunit delta' [Burkholderiales bacterium]
MEKIDFPWARPALERLPAAVSAMPHALMLSGQAGLGKRTTALFLARALLCEAERAGQGACGTCPSCHLYEAGNHPDLRIIEVGQEDAQTNESSDEESATPVKKPSRQISVDAIRALADFVATTAHRGRAKVIVIAPAEAMHPSAANALLKMLEEPPGSATYFVLVSHRSDRVLPTIRSRCFHVPFAVPAPDAALDWLKGQGIGDPLLALAQGGYAPLAAMEMAGDVEFWNQRKALLDELARAGFDFLAAADRAEPIDGPVVARLLSQWTYDLVSLKSGGKVRYHPDYAAALKSLARKLPAQALMVWYDSVLQYGRAAQHPLNKRLAMESLLSGYPGA